MRASIDAHSGAQLAGGVVGGGQVRKLVAVALDAMSDAAGARTGPIPAGGPAAIAAMLTADLLPDVGVGAEAALDELTRLLVAGSVDPADPWCAAHLHGPPLAVAAAADLVGSVVNPSMDSWDQAPIASELERRLTGELARLCFPAGNPDAVITSGGTESNLLGLLLAREAHGRVQVVCGGNAHHSVARAAWLLGLPEPLVVDCAHGRMRTDDLAGVLAAVPGPTVVVATAGTTNTGAVDPIADLRAAAPNSWLHVDAAYGGATLFSDRLAPLLDGIATADSVALDLHKFGWQPIAAGVLAVPDAGALGLIGTTADYLNPADDTDAGYPDLLGRSIRTSRRPDAFKIAVTLRAIGRTGVAALVEHCCRLAGEVADLVEAHPGLRLWGRPDLSTVLFRPRGDAPVADLRRALTAEGTAVIGRATVDGEVWFKLTLLHPSASSADYARLLDLVDARARTRP